MHYLAKPRCNDKFEALSTDLISFYASLLKIGLKNWACVNDISRLNQFVVRFGIFPKLEMIREYHKKVWCIRKGAMGKYVAA
jgi:hypothetical protein